MGQKAPRHDYPVEFFAARAKLGQFQQKCAAVLRPELRENKKLEHFRVSAKSGNAP